jgi:hypothetical protein
VPVRGCPARGVRNRAGIAETEIDAVTEEKLVPLRFWWFKRVVCVGVAYVLLLVGVRIWWGRVADARLHAAVEARRAAGEPVLLEDFVRAPIPDEKNAATYLNQAARALKLPEGFKDMSEVEAAIRSDPQAAVASELVAMNAEALRLISAAGRQAASDWKVPWRSGSMFSTLLPHLSGVRQLAKLEGVIAVARHGQGNDAGALDAVEDTLGIGAAVANGPLISNLVSVAINALAYDALERLTPTLGVSGVPADSGEPLRPAMRQQAEHLIAALLDESTCQPLTVRSMEFERMMQMDTAHLLTGRQALRPNPLLSRIPSPELAVLGPAWKLDTLLMFEWTTHVASAAGMTTWPAAEAEMPAAIERGSLIDKTAHMLSTILLPSLERAVQLSFRALATRRMAATALAIRLYELDHGRRPARLEDLVPEYLPAVPRDLYAPYERPIGYAPDAAPPVLYCISLDGVDDGGKFAFKANGAMDMDAADLVFFLDGDRPRATATGAAAASQPAAPRTTVADQPASMETVPDDNEIEDAQGDDGR